jgi:hypothetical protein
VLYPEVFGKRPATPDRQRAWDLGAAPIAAKTLVGGALSNKVRLSQKPWTISEEILHANWYTNFGPRDEQFARLSRTSRRTFAMAGTDVHAAAEALPTMLDDALTLTRHRSQSLPVSPTRIC